MRRRSTCRPRTWRRIGSARRSTHRGSRRSSWGRASRRRRPDPAPPRSRRPPGPAAPAPASPVSFVPLKTAICTPSISGLGVSFGRRGGASCSATRTDCSTPLPPAPVGGGTTAALAEPIRQDGDPARGERQDDHDPCGPQIHAAHPTPGLSQCRPATAGSRADRPSACAAGHLGCAGAGGRASGRTRPPPAGRWRGSAIGGSGRRRTRSARGSRVPSTSATSKPHARNRGARGRADRAPRPPPPSPRWTNGSRCEASNRHPPFKHPGGTSRSPEGEPDHRP